MGLGARFAVFGFPTLSRNFLAPKFSRFGLIPRTGLIFGAFDAIRENPFHPNFSGFPVWLRSFVYFDDRNDGMIV